MKRKHWKILLVSVGSTFLLLTTILAIHIYMVTRPKPSQDPRLRQLARLDVISDIDSTDVPKLQSIVAKMEGVRTVKYAANESAVIFEFDPSKQNTEAVAESLSQNGYTVQKFKVSSSQMNKGCPVMDKSSISYRLGKYFQSAIN